MDTQIISTPPNTLAAKLQAALLTKERIGILYHICYSQFAGQEKPSHCDCKHVSYEEALALVTTKKADWQVSDRRGRPYKSRQVIVHRQGAEQVTENLNAAEWARSLLKAQEVCRREAAKFTVIEAKCIKRLRKYLTQAVIAGNLPGRFIGITDTEARWMLRDPENFRDELGASFYKGSLLNEAGKYWEGILEVNGLAADDHFYMSVGGPRFFTGRYDLDAIDSHNQQQGMWVEDGYRVPDIINGKQVRPKGRGHGSGFTDDEFQRSEWAADLYLTGSSLHNQSEKQLNKELDAAFAEGQ